MWIDEGLFCFQFTIQFLWLDEVVDAGVGLDGEWMSMRLLILAWQGWWCGLAERLRQQFSQGDNKTEKKRKLSSGGYANDDNKC